MSAQLAALTERLDELKGQRNEYSIRLDKAEKECQKAEDYRQVMNLMSAHVHCCLNQEYRRELDEFWSGREDIAYANGDIAYIGREAVYGFYAERSEERGRKAGRQDGKTPGYRQMNLLGTPYIEIADDGATARGIWMSHSYNHAAKDGAVESQGVLGRYSGEFIKEDGVWKIWRRRFYPDLVADEGFMTKPVGSGEAKPAKPMVENRKKTVETELDMADNGYSPSAVPSGAPELPKPYETWSEAESYIRFKGAKK